MDITSIFKNIIQNITTSNNNSNNVILSPSPFMLMASDALHQIKKMNKFIDKIYNQYVNYNR